MRLLLKGGRIIDPSQNMDATMDLLIEKGTVSRIATTIPERKGEKTAVIDLTGMILTPGLIDMHTHLREPGHEYKETVQTGSEAAVAGGFTSIACMANTEPINDNRSVTEFILRQAQAAGMARVYPVAAVSKGEQGKFLTEFADLKDAGAVALSDDGNPVMDSRLMRNALEYASSLGIPIISHCEDTNLSAGGQMNEGYTSTELGLQGIPNTAEHIMIARDIALAEFSNVSVHIAHVSTAESVRIIREAKKRGVMVTAETAPHYFTLTDEALKEFSTNYKMYPPLRKNEDVEAIKEGLKDGTIDAIASDHAPHSSIEKDVEFEYAANGIIGLETSLSASLILVKENVLSLSQLIEKMSTNPSGILKIPGGTLKAGSNADITVIDLQKKWIVKADTFRSKSRNTPFEGRKFRGRAVLTIVGGNVKYSILSLPGRKI
ncbi:MAG: dihydroorotase [Deltaproteobacteria bacterium]|nr:dihydroorotase [Deltaproteobacteria bacterium]MBN2844741.1 dihydroorotase [Deltaproteobacteria bacterium]